MHRHNAEVEIDAAMQQDHLLEQAGQRAVRHALLDHKRTGDPIVVADESGNIVWIPADQIEIDEGSTDVG